MVSISQAFIDCFRCRSDRFGHGTSANWQSVWDPISTPKVTFRGGSEIQWSRDSGKKSKNRGFWGCFGGVAHPPRGGQLGVELGSNWGRNGGPN